MTEQDPANQKPVRIGGFPDYAAPSALKEAGMAAIAADVNQYDPCNPTGHVFTHSELTQLAKFCCHHDLLAITDDVYSAFTYGSGSTPRHVSLAQWPGMKERCIVTSSISKTFHVTGWRVGWAIAPAPIAAAISTISAKLIDTPPAPFQEASRAALSLPSSYYTQLRE
ncbi:unnamed protein product, partial [Closterium sp. Naga37s-1]